jgi:hypothetical protein
MERARLTESVSRSVEWERIGYHNSFFVFPSRIDVATFSC